MKTYIERYCANIEEHIFTVGKKTYFAVYFHDFNKLLKIDVTPYIKVVSPAELAEMLENVVNSFVFICRNGSITDV